MWIGATAFAKAFVGYARHFPDHPSKIRVLRFLGRSLFPGGLQMRNEAGIRLLVDPLDYFGHMLIHTGVIEPASLSLARRLMAGGGTFLDVGANLGVFTCSVATLPGVKCIAIDASATAFVRLLSNVARNSGAQVTAINVALSDKRSLVQLETPDAGNLGSTRVAKKIAAGSTALVAAMPLDEVLRYLSVGPIELMKVDVEGYEREVFSGMDFSAPYRPENIIMEYQPLVAGPDDLQYCSDVLSRNGYHPFTVTGEPFSPGKPIPEQNVWWRR